MYVKYLIILSLKIIWTHGRSLEHRYKTEYWQETKIYEDSSLGLSEIMIPKHLNLKLISLTYLNQYGFSQKSIFSSKYDC